MKKTGYPTAVIKRITVLALAAFMLLSAMPLFGAHAELVSPMPTVPAQNAPGTVTPTEPPQIYGETMYVKTPNGGRLNLREKNSADSKILGSYPYGAAVAVFEKVGQWNSVSVNGKVGYMFASYLSATKPVKPSPTPVPPVAKYAYVSAAHGANVNLRTGPGLKFDIIASYPNGTRVDIILKDGAWYKVSVDGKYGNVGYMAASLLKFPSETCSVRTLVNPNHNMIVNVRAGAGYNFAILRTLPVGTKVVGLDSKNGWAKVRLEDGTIGFVNEYFIK
ncbi:MAG: SH3 domain-containing protein [Oscillospiraceae bacterium]|jgi:uncharacterized protein YgiM (DUF1202 family)|nr:SH3 domain-containing protein [Oscillospiraceae bacterium]